jgi:putative membrane-bound dehydrogenase-like protein
MRTATGDGGSLPGGPVRDTVTGTAGGSTVLRSLLVCSAFLGFLGQPASPARAAEKGFASQYLVGVAKIDITPAYPVRLAGFGSRRAESDGLTKSIHASALAIDDGNGPSVLVAADLCGMPAEFTKKLAERLGKAGVVRERFTLAVTHSHTTPMVSGYLRTLFGTPIPPEHQKHIERYTAELLDKLERVANDALADRRPAKLSWGVGSVDFAINRRTKGGPTDHDLPVLAVRDLDGKLRAVWASYACHCVTLSNNRISGDWAGFAKDAIENDHPGTIALVTIGCGADQNPSSGVTGDKVEIARVQGGSVASEVKRILAGFLSPVEGQIVARAEAIELPLADLPPRSTWEEKARNTDPKQAAIAFHAKTQLSRLDRGESLATSVDYKVQTWTFGDSLALVFLPGEVVVDYSLRLKKGLDGRRIWLNAYSNDVPCYIPSERVLKEGGYEGGWAMTYYDLPGPFKSGLEDKIVTATKRAVGERFQARFDPNKVDSLPISPQQSAATFKLRPGLTVEVIAAEPLVTSPVAISFGPDGRLWVAEMYDYPSGTDGQFRPGGRVLVLSSSHGDGQYDSSTVFLDNIPFPTGVTVWRNGVLVCAAPDILYAEDTRGTGRADVVKKLFSGFGTDNYQARVNSLEYGLDGWVYGSCGLFGGTITSFTGKTLALGNRDFRIKPDTGEIEPATGRTQQGRVRDDWDNWFGCDNTHLAWHYPLPDHYIRRNPHVAPPNPAVLIGGDASEPLFPAGNLQLFKLSGPPGRPTAVCGIGVYRDDLLGKDLTGDLFACEPVNLLLHRMKLKPNGSTFKAVRAPGEEKSEFLTSTDPWFRPVQMRSGPDGCLWVVDMHRYVIEHPRWIPPEELAKVDVRAGASLGRIFRIRPTDQEPRPTVRLDKLDNAGLVAALDSPNGCQRDLAMQMLLWRDAKDVVPALTKTAATCPRSEGRLQALCTLDVLRSLAVESVRQGLGDSAAGVRRHSARFAERFAGSDQPAGPNLSLPLLDLDAQVRLQTALSLGEWSDASTGNLLVEIAFDHLSDPYLLAAVLSSVRKENVKVILADVGRAGVDRVPPLALRSLLATAKAIGGRGGISDMVRRLTRERPDRKTMLAIAAVLDGLNSAGSLRPHDLDDEAFAATLGVLARVGTVAEDSSAPLEDRLAAVSLLGRGTDDRTLLGRLMGVQSPVPLQSAAAVAMARIPGDQTSVALVRDWHARSPAIRSQILDLLLSRPGGMSQLLDAIEQKTLLASEIDAGRRQRLLSAKEKAIRERSEKVFAAAISPDRQKVLTSYQNVLETSGEVTRGRAIFAKNCSVCHRLDGIGTEVGPDLAQIQNKSSAYLLQEILDPNRNVDARYVEYRATTKVGRDYAGLLHAETATSVTLRGQEGREHVLLRADIESLESTGRSLMPEGLEKDLSRQDIADLIAFLTAKTSPR